MPFLPVVRTLLQGRHGNPAVQGGGPCGASPGRIDFSIPALPMIAAPTRTRSVAGRPL